MRQATTRRHPVATPAFLALSCVGAFAPLPARADDGHGTTPANDSDPDQRNDVIVNGAREQKPADPKQVAPLVNTPKSIVVLSRDTIDQTGSVSLQDALRTVPGVTFGAAEGGNPIGDRPFIRGFDSQGSIYVDGVRDLASQNREVFAIDSVQIVRGSDSTLGGRGSAGGTINILTKMPTRDDFLTASASYGNGNYKRITADGNLRVSDTVAFRIEGMWHDQNVVDRDAVYAKRWGVAPSVRIGLGTPTRLTISYYYEESHELPDSGIPYLYVCSATVCNAPAGNVFSTPAQGKITLLNGTTGYVARSTFYGLKDRDFRTTHNHQATIRVEHDFGSHITLRNTARYSYNDQAYSFLLPDDSNGDVFGFPLTGAAANPADGGTKLVGGGYVWRRANTRYGFTESIVDQTDLNGTFETGGIKHSFAFGTEFSWEKERRGAFLLATGSTISPRCDTFTVSRHYCTSLFNPNSNDPWVNYASDTSTVQTPIVKGAPNTETQSDASTQAIYGFDSITITPSVILNLGARLDRFKSVLTPAFAAGATAIQIARVDTLFNWQAGLVFKPTRETSIYASYATAATPPNSLLGEGREDNALPTTAATASLADALKVQKTKSYELGAKASIFHEKLALAAAIFQTSIENARVTDANGNPAFLGNTRIRGLELTASGQITSKWSVFGGYTHLDPIVVDGGFTVLTAPAVSAGGLVVQAAKTVQVIAATTGKQIPQVARNSFTASTNYQLTSRFSFGGSAIFMDRQYGGFSDNRFATQTAAGVVTVTPATVQFARGIPSYWRFDAQARYKVNDHIEVAVNAQNLTNKIYYSATFTNHYATIAPGRTVFGTVTAKF